MAHTSVVAVEDESLGTPEEERRYEVVNEQPVELAPMSAYEVWIATVLSRQLGTVTEQHQLGWTVQEMLFDLGLARRQKRRPDVAFVAFDRWPRGHRIPRTEAWAVVPNLTVEVISPTDRFDDVVAKVAEYFHAGVEQVWVVVPSQEQVHVYTSPTAVHILTRTDILPGEPVVPHFHYPLIELFDARL